LAGGSSNKNVDWFILIAFNGREVAMQGHGWEMVLQDGARERLNL